MKNQCDGCIRGLKTENGLHIEDNGNVYMCCTKDRYVKTKAYNIGWDHCQFGISPNWRYSNPYNSLDNDYQEYINGFNDCENFFFDKDKE